MRVRGTAAAAPRRGADADGWGGRGGGGGGRGGRGGVERGGEGAHNYQWKMVYSFLGDLDMRTRSPSAL